MFSRLARKHRIALLFIIMPAILSAQSNLAVLDLDNKGVSETEASIITERLRINLFETDKFIVVERERMKEILSEQAFQLTGCTSDECVIEAGNILGVAQMVAGSVTKIGNTYSITARLINVKTGQIKNTAIFDSRGEIDKLLVQGVNNIATKLAGLKSINNSYSSTLPAPSENMVFVENSTFTMGDTWGDGYDDEKPTHQVVLSNFYISKYEVTQSEWKEVIGNNPSNFKGDDLSVEKVSWYDAVGYCNKKSLKEGLTPCYTINGNNVTCNFDANGYRLPTEAEWEYAARGGNKSQGYKYSGSNTISDIAWYYDNSKKKTHKVGLKRPNELGIYDMTGNVWEWCWDWYEEYSSSSVTDPKSLSFWTKRILRGGSWLDFFRISRIANRFRLNPDKTYSNIGFRVLSLLLQNS